MDPIYTNIPSKGLVSDLSDITVDKESWTHARNAIHNSHLGEIGFLQNEPSNRFCVKFPYTLIGYVKLLESRWAVFLTDDFSSEIGIFDESKCTYTKVVNSKCLNFKRANLIRARFKENAVGSEVVYWTDGSNPMRKLDLSNIPYKYTVNDDACQTKEFSKDLDCDEISIFTSISVPSIDASLFGSGILKNGSYQFAIAYSNNKSRLTNYYSVTEPIVIWSHENFGRSIKLEISGLDRDFDQYELVVIYTIKDTTTAKMIGWFPTSTTHIEISSIDKPEYLPTTLENVVTIRPVYQSATDVTSNNQYLLWSGVKSRVELNYQPQAFNIVAKWVSYQVPIDYYKNGGNKRGYHRDEVYSFAIQWLFNTGDWSSAFHIPGRASDPSDIAFATGKDVFEKPNQDCGPDYMPKNFEVYDTSKDKSNLRKKAKCNEKPVAEGLMSYWESSELYPDNQIMFGDNRCTPIRHHKLPSEKTSSRYEDGGQFINILGVKFENIEHPKNGDIYESDIVGYRIIRGDREGNRSVIASGVFTNVRSYKESLNQEGTNEEVLYPNYPYNDLRSDTFLSSSQTFYRNGERNFRALTDYKKDQLNFYSPHSLFNNVSLGDEVIFESVESADILGYFTEVYNHPRAKVISNSVFWLSIIVGAIDGVLSVFGKKCVTEIKDGILNVTTAGVSGASNVTFAAAGLQFIQQCEDIIHGLRVKDIIKLPPLEAVAKLALKVLQTAAKAGMGVYFAFTTANDLIEKITAFMKFNKYANQYNSHGFFNRSVPVRKDNRRRHIDYYQNLYDGINVVQGVKFNNFKRERSTYVKINDEIANPGVVDNSRFTINDSRKCSNPNDSFKSKASVFYGHVKRRLPNQYGQLDSITYLDTGYFAKVKLNQDKPIYSTDTIFGGDIFINKFAIRRTHHFFRQNLTNSNSPDGTEYDYSLYRNVGYPRYWLNSERYDLSEIVVVGKVPNKLPTNKYNLDCFKREASTRILNLKNVEGKFYLYNSGVMEFIVESEYNLDYRDYTTAIQNFYSTNFSNLAELFRSDQIEQKEEFIYDLSLSKLNRENAIYQQRLDFNPNIETKSRLDFKNRVIYSLPASKEQKGDNWLIYLGLNYYDFPLAEFGNLTTMQPVDNQRIIFLFDKASPYITIGRDELQTEGGVKITIGDAGLFAREPRPLVYTDYYYGNSQSKWAFVNTQFGSFYPSQRQGRMFMLSDSLNEPSREAMHFWFKNYLPLKLNEDFPDYNNSDNPVIGVGLLSGFDNTNECYYLSKRDFKLKPEFKEVVTYEKGQFKAGLQKIDIGDPLYFDDASWTLSYSLRDKAFISWHDWHPNWILQGESHFMTVKNDEVWKHNERCDSFCNFYGVDYPFEIEFLVNNGQEVGILKSIEYIMKVGKYFNSCRDFHHTLDDNFDIATIHNSEQISGYLRLKISPKNDITSRLEFPKAGLGEYIVRYDKEENKYRLNQFWDIVKDRGEFTGRNFPLWTTSPNGYIKTITDKAVDYEKSEFQRKRFRHMQHKVFLRKEVSGDKKMIFYINNAKEVPSYR